MTQYNFRSIPPRDYVALHAGSDLEENEEFHDSFDIPPETALPGTSHGNSASQCSTPLAPATEAHGLQDVIEIERRRARWGDLFAHLEF